MRLELLLNHVLHTGATWSGAIGKGEILLRASGFEESHRFRDLKPTRADDLEFNLGSFDEQTRDTGCGSFKADRMVMASSSQASRTLGSYAALVLDGDPTTSWVDDEPTGGVGAWIQLPALALEAAEDTRPSSLIRKVRGLALQAGATKTGRARPAAIAVECITTDEQTDEQRRSPISAHALRDMDGRQEIVFPKPQHWLALRVTTTKVQGQPTDHVTIAELELLF